MKKQTRTNALRAAAPAKKKGLRKRTVNASQTPSPIKYPILFEYKGWSIVRADSLNLRLIHESDDLHNKFRFYPSLSGALHGLARYVGNSSPDLQAAMQSFDELNAKITKLAL